MSTTIGVEEFQLLSLYHKKIAFTCGTLADEQVLKMFFDSVDLFSSRLNQLNFEGRQRIHTGIGLFCSLLVSTTILFFGGVKLTHLVNRHNPIISKYD